METQQERLVRYLNDMWAAEKALVDNLNEMADEVNDPNVRSIFLEHARVTKQQEENLEARIRALGEEPSGGKGFFNRIMSGFADLIQGAHDEYDKTTQDLCKAYAVEHLECAMYQSLESYANAIGDTSTATLCRQHYDQEKLAAETLWPLIAPSAQRPAQLATGEERLAA